MRNIYVKSEENIRKPPLLHEVLTVRNTKPEY